jgi:hypothetical protein
MKIRAPRSHDIASFKTHGNLEIIFWKYFSICWRLLKGPQPDCDLRKVASRYIFYLQKPSETIKEIPTIRYLTVFFGPSAFIVYTNPIAG